MQCRSTHVFFFFFLMIRRPPRSPLFPPRRSSDPHGHRPAVGWLECHPPAERQGRPNRDAIEDRKSTRLNSSHTVISYAVFCLKKKTNGYEHKPVLDVRLQLQGQQASARPRREQPR